MPISYTIDEEAQLVRIVGTGRVADEEMVKCVSSLRKDPKLAPDMNTLSDMREIEVGFTSEGVARMIDVMESTAHRRSASKAAIVVGSDVAFGMGRMFEMQSVERVKPSFRIFRDMGDARRRLGIE
jgi:hypothetical protein